MSSFQVTFTKLQCDAVGCGVVYDNIGKPVSHLRELAAKDGWRHKSVRSGASNWLRAVDLCPGCPDDAELVEHIGERQRRAGRRR